MLKEQLINLLTVKKPRYVSKEFLTDLRLYDVLIEQTSFLPLESTIAERMYNVINDINQVVRCQTCKKEIRTWHKFEESVEQYLYSFCSVSCCKSFEPDMSTFKYEDFSDVEKLVETSSISLLKNNPVSVNKIKSFLNNKNIDYTKFSFAQALYFVKNKLVEIPKCVCGKELEYFGKGEYRKNCSYKCSANNGKTVSKRINTNINKYGVENVFQSTEVKNKIVEQNLSKYGASHRMKNVEYYEDFKRNMEDKIGYENPFQDPNISKRIAQIHKDSGLYERLANERRDKTYDEKFAHIKTEKSDLTPLFTRNEYVGLKDYKNNVILRHWFKCNKCGGKFSRTTHVSNEMFVCPFCRSNMAEKQISDFLNNIGIEHKRGDRQIISPKELDFLINDKNIAIEYDGLYWHSDEYKKDNYHLDKTTSCLSKGIRLIHIFEDEWIYKSGVVKNRLKHLFNKHYYTIGARKCVLKTISNSLKAKFLNKYHIQGNDNSSIMYGAFYKNHLVGVITFGPMRAALGSKNQEGNYELYRFCTIGSMFSFPGLASKMLEHFKKNNFWKKIVTYSDRRWNDGKVYEKIGFTFHHFSNPNYWYVDGKSQKRYYRFAFRKSVLKDKLEVFDENLTEKQNMDNNGYSRIYDCGNAVYVMENVKNI